MALPSHPTSEADIFQGGGVVQIARELPIAAISYDFRYLNPKNISRCHSGVMWNYMIVSLLLGFISLGRVRVRIRGREDVCFTHVV